MVLGCKSIEIKAAAPGVKLVDWVTMQWKNGPNRCLIGPVRLVNKVIDKGDLNQYFTQRNSLVK